MPLQKYNRLYKSRPNVINAKLAMRETRQTQKQLRNEIVLKNRGFVKSRCNQSSSEDNSIAENISVNENRVHNLRSLQNTSGDTTHTSRAGASKTDEIHTNDSNEPSKQFSDRRDKLMLWRQQKQKQKMIEPAKNNFRTSSNVKRDDYKWTWSYVSPAQRKRKVLKHPKEDGEKRKPLSAWLVQPVGVCLQVKKDVQIFYDLVEGEKLRLTKLCKQWDEVEKSSDVPDAARGDILSAVGKAQLLMKQRFTQFLSLIDDCAMGRGEKETTTNDLQGFWDMISYQVDDVDKLFNSLDSMKNQNWRNDVKLPDPPKKVKKVMNVSKKSAAKSNFAAFRAAMKENIGTPVKMFKAGNFFEVTSPIVQAKFHCDAGSSSKLSDKKPLRTMRRNRKLDPDVQLFYDLVAGERLRLTELCKQWEELENSCNIPDLAKGDILSAVGKARLLMNQRFAQFSKLIDDCAMKRGERETTCNDLQGFWDMISYQVEDVDKLFGNLDEMKKQDWQTIEKTPKPPKKMKKVKVSKRPVAKSKFASFRAAMQENKDTPVKTFKAGNFFEISTPVVEAKSHCVPDTTPLPSKLSNKRPHPTSVRRSRRLAEHSRNLFDSFSSPHKGLQVQVREDTGLTPVMSSMHLASTKSSRRRVSEILMLHPPKRSESFDKVLQCSGDLMSFPEVEA